MRKSNFRQQLIDNGKLTPAKEGVKTTITPFRNVFGQATMRSGEPWRKPETDYDDLVWLPCKDQYFDFKLGTGRPCETCDHDRKACGLSYHFIPRL